MSTSFLEIVELPDGRIILRRAEDEEVLVTLDFSADAKAFLQGHHVEVAKAMLNVGVQMAGPSCSRRNVVECCDSSVAESLFVHVCLSDLSFLCPLSRESKGWSGSKLAARVSRVHSSGATPSYGAVRPQPVVRGCLQIASVGLKANRAAWHDLYRDKWSSFSTGARRLL